MPVNWKVYERLLKESKYDQQQTEYLVKGFKEGFSIGCTAKLKGLQTSPNLKLRVGSQTELWNKVMEEVKDHHFTGPYKPEVFPFKDYIQSPICLVPKDGGSKTRLIFHLSYSKKGSTSVNINIPKDSCTVKYNDLDMAIKRCLQEGVSCNMSKSDMSMAFHNVPLGCKSWAHLVLKAQHPITQ